MYDGYLGRQKILTITQIIAMRLTFQWTKESIQKTNMLEHINNAITTARMVSIDASIRKRNVRRISSVLVQNFCLTGQRQPLTG